MVKTDSYVQFEAGKLTYRVVPVTERLRSIVIIFFTLYICSAFGYNSVINTSEHVFGNTPEVSMKNDRNGRILP